MSQVANAMRKASLRRARGRVLRASLAGFAISLAALPGAAQPLPTDFSELAARCAPQIHPVTLTALVLQESQANPYAIGINGGTARLERQPRNYAEAVATAGWLKANGHNFDAGLGQVNVKNLGWLGLDVADLFDPCVNLRASATVLADCYVRASKGQGGGQAALRSALSCYNTGNFRRGFANGYVEKVARRVGVVVPAGGSALFASHGTQQAGAAAAPEATGAPEPSRRAATPDAFSGRSSDVFSESGQGRPVEDSVTLARRATVNGY